MRPLPTLNAREGRFLHIIPDDKYIDQARSMFEEAAPNAHDFLHFGASGSLRYVNSFRPLVIQPNHADRHDLLDLVPSYSGVFVHFLNKSAKLLIHHAPPGTRAAWLAWGADYYQMICTREQLLLPKTRALLETIGHGVSMPSFQEYISSIPGALMQPAATMHRVAMRKKLRRQAGDYAIDLAIINRFRLMAPPIREDYDALLTANPALQVAYFDWNYWTEGVGNSSRPMQPTGNNILLGNSATPENNHLDALARLPDRLPDDVRIICPLSYGNARYAKAVERAGRDHFGHRFITLGHYMEQKAYISMISSCSMVIMNHVRQQGLGNILLAAGCGARVFLNPDSPANSALSRIGIPVHTIGKIPEFLKDGCPPLSVEEVREVRKHLQDRLSRDTLLNKTRTLLAEVSKTSASDPGFTTHVDSESF